MADPQFCFLFIDHWAACMSKAEWAAWAQVLGATAAIAAGAYGIAWQVKNQWQLYRSELHDEELQAVSDLCDLFEEGRKLLAELEVATSSHAGYCSYLLDSETSSQWIHTLEVFRGTDLNSVPGIALKVAFRLGRAQLEHSYDFRRTACQQAFANSLPSAHVDADKTRARGALAVYLKQVTVFNSQRSELKKRLHQVLL